MQLMTPYHTLSLTTCHLTQLSSHPICTFSSYHHPLKLSDSNTKSQSHSWSPIPCLSYPPSFKKGNHSQCTDPLILVVQSWISMVYLTAEVVELTGSATCDNKKHCIVPCHLQLVIWHNSALVPSTSFLPITTPQTFWQWHKVPISFFQGWFPIPCWLYPPPLKERQSFPVCWSLHFSHLITDFDGLPHCRYYQTHR